MMLRSKSRGGSIDSGKRRHASIFSRTISASKLCRCDAMRSQIDSDAIVSLERKPTIKHSSENGIDRLLIVQEQMGKLEEELKETREQLNFVEEEKNRAINELSEMKHVAYEINVKATDELSPRKSRELYAEIRILKEMLTHKQEELKIKDKNIKQDSLNKSRLNSEESKLEIASLHEKIESLDTSFKQNGRYLDHSCNEEMENLKYELELAKENEKAESSKAKALNDEMSLLKNEMKLANEAEEKSRKALDDLALALKEVASEACEAKEKLSATQLELGQVKKEAGNLKEMIKSIKARYKKLLDEAKEETELYRNIADRLKLEVEESLVAWNGKEMSFIACIREAEEERDLALQEAAKLNESLNAAEQMLKQQGKKTIN
ncbi:putative web family protein, chloroplastic [Nicotiana attenuata]|uniref:Web family protein, chloroplastic n=1 Tax=Nicotiana attenuata TaxID=49451 RepID=A0A314L4P4_NICAT|nr:putative web family protein, chloroplastic [Nicotiana attenuata]